ncbi:hypothetical protein CRG98_003433 [Punica granatum]|uniref:Retrotransposon gag domain-containing protein n=1 Tax=Punica granatum TaxID=22663 RepID=A0A2I0L7W4_PUNGR|nr:hypothetical protein CRG98_003433 [Punica granatum]
MSWRRFEKGLLVRFGSSEYEDTNEAMNKIRQKGAFREYLGEFERLMNTLRHWHPSALLDAFMTGTATEGAGAQVVQPPPRTNLGSMRQLTWEEMQRRREQNLCFNCDEKFVPGHRCSGIKVMGVEFKVTLYALPIIGVEVILGVSWLQQLGPTLTDYKEMTMEFGTEGKRHILRGVVPEGTRVMEARSVEQEVTLGAQLFMAVEARVNTVAEGRARKRIAEVFIRGIVRLHGIPESVVTDRDRIFMSSFWWELFKLHGTKLKMSPAYHPQIDG